MSLADRLGALQVAPSTECAVCTYYDRLDVDDKATFDAWLADGGQLSALWRSCVDDPDNPMHLKRARFAELVNDHHRGGARVAGR